MDAVTSYLVDGSPDPISTLYNNISITAWPTNTTKDIYSMTTPLGRYNPDNFTEDIPMLASSNLNAMMSIDTGDTAKLCN